MVDYRHQLAGLSDEEIAAAADAARERGLSDRWLLTLTNTTQQPQLLALRDRQTRENLFAAGWTRNQQGDEHDTRDWYCGWRRSAHSRLSCWEPLITPAGR
ncbi:hypothetical protein KPZU09_15620 [Klebsiella pneumoniae]|uniref:Peptidyl-dipeptidase Dcp n=1 Tax=Klebsiella pneumoniae TaxID=573 RepID=A0A919HXG8_KLEPN|nr:hypothetical protein KPZU09_15620 [Klebsiella pneumoniae]